MDLLRRRATALALAAAAWLPGLLPPPAQAQEEVPFITTPDRVTEAMLTLAGVGPADFVLDLGSGDGRIVITAARRFGARGLGVEIVPELVQRSRANARAAGVADRAEFRQQDLFETDLRQAQVITMYLLPEVNLQLRPALLALAPGTRIVSHDWDLGDWTPLRSVTLAVPEKAIGRDKQSTVHLWVVPAALGGWWCAETGEPALALQVTQRFDRFSATLRQANATTPVAVFDGQVLSTVARSGSGAGAEAAAEVWRLRADGATLQLERAPGAAGAWTGRRFTRAADAAQGCPARR